MKLLHLISSLSSGGGEMMLYKLLSRLNSEFEPQVISLTDIGTVGKKIEALGVPVKALGMERGVPNPLAVLRLTRWLKEYPPHIIQTWMYHADLLGGLAARLAGNIPVVWGIRHSDLDPRRNKRTTIWTATICARLSPWLPARIVCCSEASRQVHSKLGYTKDKMITIPNGFNLVEFGPDPEARLSVCNELGISKEVLLIGIVGRFHPLKDHHNFVQAAGHLHAHSPHVHFLLCGDEITWENQALVKWIDSAGIRNRCHLLGRREDIPRLLAALDIATTSSCGEGFPNVIGEAMACGVPCVVTDVGDSALIVGDTGKVVPPENPETMAWAWRELLDMDFERRRQLGLAARHRIEKHFNLTVIVKRYEAMYKELVA